jgi:hypothetical protein
MGQKNDDKGIIFKANPSVHSHVKIGWIVHLQGLNRRHRRRTVKRKALRYTFHTSSGLETIAESSIGTEMFLINIKLVFLSLLMKMMGGGPVIQVFLKRARWGWRFFSKNGRIVSRG